MEKRPFFRAATAGLGKYGTGGYGRIGVYRDKPIFHQKLCSRTKGRRRDEIDMSNANPAPAYPM